MSWFNESKNESQPSFTWMDVSVIVHLRPLNPEPWTLNPSVNKLTRISWGMLGFPSPRPRGVVPCEPSHSSGQDRIGGSSDWSRTEQLLILSKTRWWNQIFFIFTPTWGNDSFFWLIFFKGVGSTTNQCCIWVLPKIIGTPKWMVYKGKPY